MRKTVSAAIACLPALATANSACNVVSDEVFDKLRGAGLSVLVNYTSGPLGMELRTCLKEHQGCMGHDDASGQHVGTTDGNGIATSAKGPQAYTNFMVQSFARPTGSTCMLVYATGGSHFEGYSWHGWKVDPRGTVTLLDLARVDVPVQHSPAYLAQQLQMVHARVVDAGGDGIGEQKITRARADIRSLETALTMYRLDNRAYPTTEQGLAALVARPPDAPHWRPGGYLSSLSKDPWGNAYQYSVPGSHAKGYDVYSLGPSAGRDSDAIIGNWNSPD